jgi:myosin-7
MADSKFWVPHKEQVFLPGFIKADNDKETVFKLDNGEEVKIKKPHDCQPVFDEHSKGVPNVVAMQSISPGAILETLNVRYMRDDIYTNVQTIVIACNPFQQLNLYTAETVDKYAKTSDTMSMPPHLYAIGSKAQSDLASDGKNQAVLISGESGAGKTESCKQVLSYLADVSGSEGGIQDKIISTNPVLEAFGNSKTERNNNSSRFGKWMEIQFNQKNQITGAQIIDYLLEKTRIIDQNPTERSYHIFYLLMNSPKCAELDMVKDNKAYKCMDMSMMTADGIDDEEDYGEMANAWKELGFTDAEVNDLYGMVAGILHLSNATFKDATVRGGDGSECTDQKSMDLAGKHLKLDAKALSIQHTEKKLVVGKDVTMAPVAAKHASTNRDVLRKLMYDKMFSWLVQRLNQTLVLPDAKGGSSKVIGLLDIAGFESFVFNTWEQLCINLSNENLQQHFNNFVFKTEMADYESEGVTIDKIDFADNADILELIQAHKGSIMTILDEECPVSKATDKTYVAKLKKAFDKQHKRFTGAKGDDAEFTLDHFAGKVKYDCNGWLEKNMDNPPGGTGDLFSGSGNKILAGIGKEMVEADANKKSNKKVYVSTSFRKSLKTLMTNIENSSPHFIRCITPTGRRSPASSRAIRCLSS